MYNLDAKVEFLGILDYILVWGTDNSFYKNDKTLKSSWQLDNRKKCMNFFKTIFNKKIKGR